MKNSYELDVMPTLTLHITLKSRKLTGGGPRIFIAYQADRDGSMARMLDHRGVDHQNLAHRSASQEEMDNESHPYRYELIPYTSWSRLITDERKYTVDPKWFAALDGLRKRFPQFENDAPVEVQSGPPHVTQATLFEVRTDNALM